MKATKKEELISYEEILSRLGGGYDGFMYYHGSVPKKCKRPWGRDKSPSFGFFQKEGIWYFGDFATEERGTLADFVMKMFNLNWIDAINKIKWDFGLTQVKNLDAVKVTWERPIIESKPDTRIVFTTCRFDEKHAKYWNDYHLSEDYLKKYNVFRVKDLSINRQRVLLPINTLNFVYFNPPTKKCKILRIGGNIEDKWKTNASGDTLWFKEKIEKCSKLIISKSVKDSLCLTLFDINTVAVQSESFSCIEKNEDWLESLDCAKIINFGTDFQGKEQSLRITNKYGYKHYNVPDKLLKDSINDVAEWCKFDIKSLEKHLKIKKIIL